MACQFYFLNLKKYDGCILITENKELNLSHIYICLVPQDICNVVTSHSLKNNHKLPEDFVNF